MHPILISIKETFENHGGAKYAEEDVTQLQHALQSAAMAEDFKGSDSLVVASLLHDIGHILDGKELPEALEEDLHDSHESRAYEWLLDAFGHAVADPVKLHVAAKRYLCTTDKSYLKKLSPTSLKSFEDQGGPMSEEEVSAFEKEQYFQDAVVLRQWDDQAKDPHKITPPLEHYLELMEPLLHK